MGNASVRTKLLLVALVPFLSVLPILFFLIFYWGVAYYDRLLTFKVNSDLAVAHEYFIRVRDRVGLDVSSLGNSYPFVLAAKLSNNASLQRFLSEKQKALGLDFLNFLDTRGRIRVSSNVQKSTPLDDSGESNAHWPVVRASLLGLKTTEIDIYSEAQLRQIDARVALQTQLPFV